MHSKILFYIFKAKNSLKKIQVHWNPISNKPIKRRKSKIQTNKRHIMYKGIKICMDDATLLTWITKSMREGIFDKEEVWEVGRWELWILFGSCWVWGIRGIKWRRKQLNTGAWSSQRRLVKTYRCGKYLPRKVTDTAQSMGEGWCIKREERWLQKSTNI